MFFIEKLDTTIVEVLMITIFLCFQVATTLNVWTGTYGVLTLDDGEIYLDATNDLIPAPQVMFVV